MRLSKKFLFLSSLALSLFITGCFEISDSCRKQGGFLVCSSTQQATICSPYGSESFKCVTKEECGSYTCDISNNTEVHFIGTRNISWIKPQFTTADLSYEKMISKIVNADLGFAQSLGMDLATIENLSKGREINPEALLRIAKNLNESQENIKVILNDFTARFRAERLNGESLYWKSCMASGSWITNMNSKCEQSDWNGCSPESGAQFCLTDLGAKRLKLKN